MSDALEVLSGGGVAAIPTDTVYGLAADPNFAGATRRIFEIKGRPMATELPVLVASTEQASCLAAGSRLPEQARILVERFWPGGLTIVVRRAEGLLWDLGGNGASIGLRCPAHPVALELCRRAGPLAVTSANLHGGPPLVTAEAVAACFGSMVDVVVDAGRCDGVPSTVVGLVSGEPVCIREGSLPWGEVLATLEL